MYIIMHTNPNPISSLMVKSISIPLSRVVTLAKDEINVPIALSAFRDK